MTVGRVSLTSAHPEKVYVYAGIFDPFGEHHRWIVEQLVSFRNASMKVDPAIPAKVLLWPLGSYEGKEPAASKKHRREMIMLGLQGLDVEIDWRDFDRERGYTSTYRMQSILSFQPRSDLRDEFMTTLHMPGILREVWHVVGADNVEKILDWNEGIDLWNHGRFLIVPRPGYRLTKTPRKSLELQSAKSGSSTDIRKFIAEGGDWEHLVHKSVAAYIKEYGLYNWVERKVA